MSDIVPISTEVIARNACAYARNYILKGKTQLVNNTYSILQRYSLLQQMRELRALSNQESKYSLEIDKAIHFFYQTIALSKKFSLGNCGELAFMALDYIVNYAPPNINAEVYCINGGDHVFLVIGRKKGSDLNKPETWGKDAYICDPWADKIENQVYPASEYLTKLKSYSFSSEIQNGKLNYTNYTEV